MYKSINISSCFYRLFRLFWFNMQQTGIGTIIGQYSGCLIEQYLKIIANGNQF